MRRVGPNASLVGKPGKAIDMLGPALVVERRAFLRNVQCMQDLCRSAGMALRPHAKTHKCSQVAKVQLAEGAVGICCATAREVLSFAENGVEKILLTSPLVEPRKIEMLASLPRNIELSVVIDHATQVRAWNDAAKRASRHLSVLIDVDLGMGRTGVRGDEVVALAAAVAQAEGLHYAGVQAYSGLVQHIESHAARRAAYEPQMKSLARTIEELMSVGLPPAIVSGGGTGTFALDLSMGIINEAQFGSYIFMDVEYAATELCEETHNPFEPSLFVRSRVISSNAPGGVTIDAGFKSLAADGPMPVLRDTVGKYQFFGDEYGRVTADEENLPALGEIVDIVVPHCDPTVNLHDFIHVLEGDTLMDIWPIEARGSL